MKKALALLEKALAGEAVEELNEFDDPLHDADFHPRETSVTDTIAHVLSVVATRPFPYETFWPTEDEDLSSILGPGEGETEEDDVAKTIKVGEKVMWSGGFGAQAEKPARITGIEVCDEGEKNGDPVDKASLDDNLVVTLDNGHWAYGDQIRKISKR